MCAVKAEERPSSARAVFDAICENEFQFFAGIDAVKVRAELARFGLSRFPGETELAELERKVLTLEAVLEPTKRRLVELEREVALLKKLQM